MRPSIALAALAFLLTDPVRAVCPDSGSVDRDGWHVEWRDTTSDGFEVHSVTWNGSDVLTSAKLVEWHADSGGSGFIVSTGCGGGGGGFAVFPHGDPVVQDLIDPDDGVSVIGFEIVRDYRMASWGANCNWRFDQRYWFYADGSFRVVAGAYGRGCAAETIYRPVFRIDFAIDGDAGDTVDAWIKGWVEVTEETTWPVAPSDVVGWRIRDAGGTGYHVERAAGQFGDGGRGDAPFVYLTLHDAAEGDTDLSVIGSCCEDDASQGPEGFVDGESVVGQNLVLWYVPQAVDDQDLLDGDGYYAWTISGEPMVETYPAFMGPRFVRLEHPVAVASSMHGSGGLAVLEASPNPLPGRGTLSLRLDEPAGPVELKIYDAAGRLVRTLHRVGATDVVAIPWDGTDTWGRDVASGTYFVVAQTPTGIVRGRVVVLR